ncbi:MAG: hypothetical protein FJX21_05105 [Alphaproteobacteria bacterium]|nr:hypothetical protein [Alphaproteobacteria bacterium]
MAQAPCFAQWESPAMGRDFAADPARLAEDPLWAASGARDAAEYARWAHHVCGMACVRMVLAARGLGAPPILELARAATARGAYVEEAGGAIRGMVYAPCVAWLREDWGIEAEVVVGIDAHGIVRAMERAEFLIASVHPSIRAPDAPPPRRGGHLVLVLEAGPDAIVFHNPSGFDAATRCGARLAPAKFDRFFAGRAIAIAR